MGGYGFGVKGYAMRLLEMSPRFFRWWVAVGEPPCPLILARSSAKINLPTIKRKDAAQIRGKARYMTIMYEDSKKRVAIRIDRPRAE